MTKKKPLHDSLLLHYMKNCEGNLCEIPLSQLMSSSSLTRRCVFEKKQTLWTASLQNQQNHNHQYHPKRIKIVQNRKQYNVE